jgi:hypothetical protein
VDNHTSLAVQIPSARLPLKRGPAVVEALSLLIALLLAVASAIGILYPEAIYPAEELRHLSVANDIVSLVLVLPFLLASLWLVRRGRLVGLLFWPGALMVVFYNGIAYLVSLPVNVSFALNLLLAPLSVYTLGALLSTIDGTAVRARLAGRVRERFTGGALILLGVLFGLFVFGAVAGAIVDETPVAAGDRGVHVADMMIVPALIGGGYLLWRRQALGYVAGAGLLFQTSMLFVGVIAVLLLQPLLSGGPLPATDLAVLLVMALVSFVPFGLFMRGIGTE